MATQTVTCVDCGDTFDIEDAGCQAPLEIVCESCIWAVAKANPLRSFHSIAVSADGTFRLFHFIDPEEFKRRGELIEARATAG